SAGIRRGLRLMDALYAFVTLLTSDSYLPGALTLVAALKDVHPIPPVPPEVDFQTVCLVTPETVDVSSIKLLRRAFNVVIGVEIIEHDNHRGLQLLGRPDLTTVLTKLHVFRLTQYKKIIFLDADVLPTRPLSHLFTLDHEFSAVPDVGWPDIFNSGLMVLTPSDAHFTKLMELSKTEGSWDGGDQGLLNEWRGDSWHRLSFTYNTTPTAVYTYAPAYERFGSKISAIHFIGPNKPWIHIPWRAPGSADAQSKASESLQAYDYSALVDRWYAVYDKHYRSTPVGATTEYAARRYEPAWDQESGASADMPVISPSADSSKTLSLDELRRMAIEGFSGPSYAQSGEGTYLRMPLEGRLDLMRPRAIVTTTSLESDGGPTTPLADDHFFEDGAAASTAWVPQQPQSGHLAGAHGYAVPPDVPSSHLYYRHPIVHDGSQSQHPAHHHKQHPSRPSYTRKRSSFSARSLPTHARPSSPPMMLWDPAVEPPPTTAPPSSFPSETYFPNVWDQSSRNQPRPGNFFTPPPPTSLFEEPPPTQIPRQLIQEKHYASVVGDVSEDKAIPDPSRVKPVFPWEETPRHAPARVFPHADQPSSDAFIQQEQRSEPTASSIDSPSSPAGPITPQQRLSPLSPPERPLTSSNFGYMNAWDTVPSIQKYASRLVRPSPTQPLQPASDVPESKKGQRRPYGAYESGNTSAEGDDEETDDDERDPVERERDIRRRSRSGSLSKGKKEYRSQGVQTVRPEMRDAAVQVAIISARSDADTPAKGPLTSTREKTPSHSASGSGSASPTHPRVRQAQVAESFIGKTKRVSPAASPTGGASPRLMRSPHGSSTDVTRTFLDSTPRRAPPPVTTTPLPRMRPHMPAMTRTTSMGSDALSTPSTVGPPRSPEDEFAPLPSAAERQRKGSRVWDPARGVEIFKKGSEEVLARFLRMGS
ncbi:hypothetical protein K488DRAFT_36107, partial [Vararia minispora EC-137]